MGYEQAQEWLRENSAMTQAEVDQLSWEQEAQWDAQDREVLAEAAAEHEAEL